LKLLLSVAGRPLPAGGCKNEAPVNVAKLGAVTVLAILVILVFK